jgi:hypothetical protein
MDEASIYLPGTQMALRVARTGSLAAHGEWYAIAYTATLRRAKPQPIVASDSAIAELGACGTGSDAILCVLRKIVLYQSTKLMTSWFRVSIHPERDRIWAYEGDPGGQSLFHKELGDPAAGGVGCDEPPLGASVRQLRYFLHTSVAPFDAVPFLRQQGFVARAREVNGQMHHPSERTL